ISRCPAVAAAAMSMVYHEPPETYLEKVLEHTPRRRLPRLLEGDHQPTPVSALKPVSIVKNQIPRTKSLGFPDWTFRLGSLNLTHLTEKAPPAQRTHHFLSPLSTFGALARADGAGKAGRLSGGELLGPANHRFRRPPGAPADLRPGAGRSWRQ